ncbi:CoA transferase [Aquabacterium sp. A7-Y]|uniref:CoA transferase n=1 Tax=Aquabacterium sp. A7-Y TaxID=1349605 RepID=UPI0039FBA723
MNPRAQWWLSHGSTASGCVTCHLYPYGPFPAGDGRTVMFGLQNEREWQAFCHVVLENPSLGDDPRFACNALRNAHRSELRHLIVECFASLSSSEVRERLDRAQLASADANELRDVWRHPQLAARRR